MGHAQISGMTASNFGNAQPLRCFWLQPSDMEDVASTVTRLEGTLVDTEMILQQVLELVAVAGLQKTELRRSCLEYFGLQHGLPPSDECGASPWVRDPASEIG